MFKKLIFIIPLTIVALMSAPVATYALEDEVFTGTIAEPIDTPTGDIPSENDATDPATPAEPSDTTPTESSDATPDDSSSGAPTPEAEPSDEPESTSNPVLDQIAKIVDPELWPLILSACALGLSVILIIIINLVARRKSKKIMNQDSQDIRSSLDKQDRA